MKIFRLTPFHIVTRPLLVAAIGSTLAANVLNRHGFLFDGCPSCAVGRVPTAGMAVDLLSDNVDFSADSATSPDGIAFRPTRPTASGQPKVDPPAAAAAATTMPKGAPPAMPPPAKSEPPPEIKQGDDGYWRVSFANLASFKFTPPPETSAPKPGSTKDIPKEIVALEGKRVCVSGFMLPLKLENGFAKEFLLIRSPMMCCYGIVPGPNEWIVVKMKGKGAVPAMDMPLNFYGTLHIGEVYEDKMFAGVYQMDGEKVSVN